jgi:hypothetical protein
MPSSGFRISEESLVFNSYTFEQTVIFEMLS